MSLERYLLNLAPKNTVTQASDKGVPTPAPAVALAQVPEDGPSLILERNHKLILEGRIPAPGSILDPCPEEEHVLAQVQDLPPHQEADIPHPECRLTPYLRKEHQQP